MKKFNDGVKKALGRLPGSKDLKKALVFDDEHEFFTQLECSHELQPDPQSVEEFLSARNLAKRDMLTGMISVIPIGFGQSNEDRRELYLFRNFLSAFIAFDNFQLIDIKALTKNNMRILTSLGDPNCNSRKCYRAYQLIEIIARNISADSSLAIGILNDGLIGDSGNDSQVCKSLNSSPNIVIVSFKKLLESSLSSPGMELMLKFQLLVHTVLHIMYLEDCAFFECLMNKNVCSMEHNYDNSPIFLCPLCLRKLSLVIPGFDVVKRYQHIAQFISNLGEPYWDAFRNWYMERISVITNIYTPTPFQKLTEGINSNSSCPLTTLASHDGNKVQLERISNKSCKKIQFANKSKKVPCDKSKLLLLKKKMRRPSALKSR